MNMMDERVTLPEMEPYSSLPSTLGEMLYERARSTPDKIALNFFEENRKLTYADLHESVRRVGSSLLGIGARKGSHIAMMLPNSTEFTITWMAIAWIGAVSVPLNPRFKEAELDYALNDSDADFLVVDEACLAVFERLTQTPVRLSRDNIIVRTRKRNEGYTSWTDLLDGSLLPPEPDSKVTAHDVVSILYTSGTTGRPKGCMLDHQFWLLIAAGAIYSQGGSIPKNTLVYEPLFYIQGGTILLASMLSGGTAHCSSAPSISRMLGWIQEFDVDYCAFPVPAVHIMEDAPVDVGKSLKFVHAWYYHGDWVERLENRYDVCARDSYAMTENGFNCIVPVDRPDLAAKGSVGVAAPGREIRIVDDSGKDLDVGETGEAWTAGPGHFQGYYRRPAANRDSFRGRWFRTGDLMRLDEDGGYYLVGRTKDMIKRSGENISSAEVEDCLCSLPGIVMSAVVPVPDPERGEEVKAYVQLADDLSSQELPPELILDHCSSHLANFKVPRYIAYIETFPLTAANDKVAKSELIAGTADLRAGSFDRIKAAWL